VNSLAYLVLIIFHTLFFAIFIGAYLNTFGQHIFLSLLMTTLVAMGYYNRSAISVGVLPTPAGQMIVLPATAGQAFIPAGA
jgi:hypothetical protein